MTALRAPGRARLALLAGGCLSAAVLLAPELAPAATVGTKTRANGAPVGPVRYHATRGVANRVRVEPTAEREFRITDPAERVRPFGGCERVDRHTALCRMPDHGGVRILVLDRADRVVVDNGCQRRQPSCISLIARGGKGDDVLLGGGTLYGDSGHDLLRGARGGHASDEFHGGPGRDRLEGRGPSRFVEDRFFDDETDAQASRDVVIGGRGARAQIVYAKRRRGLRIDLHRKRMGPEGDRVSGVKSVIGGAGDDVLIGTGGFNALGGGPGDDRLEGRGSADALGGGDGDDLVLGGDGPDRFTEALYPSPGGGGSDRLFGGAGSDYFATIESPLSGANRPDEIHCDAADQPVVTERLDRLHGACELLRGWDAGLVAGLDMRLAPRLTPQSAVYTLNCGPTESVEEIENGAVTGYSSRCRGLLSLRTPDGRLAGSREFEAEVAVGSRTPWMNVEVPLTAEARRAIQQGTVVEVLVEPLSSSGFEIPPAGYRALLRG